MGIHFKILSKFANTCHILLPALINLIRFGLVTVRTTYIAAIVLQIVPTPCLQRNDLSRERCECDISPT